MIPALEGSGQRMSAASLNPEQRRAVSHRDGPLLVLAGPGSGKTRVVTARIARFLEDGIPAAAIMAVTFTNKAAREMRQRVAALVPRGRAKGLTIATIHSACLRILRTDAELLGYSKGFSIYDESSQRSLMRTVLRDLKGKGATSAASKLLSDLSVTKSGAQRRDDPETDPDKSEFNSYVQGRYLEELKARNAMDFDDIILETLRLLRENEEARRRWQDRWRYLLVDEYQDVNAQQDELMTLLAGERDNLCVVGDDDQSLYGWRGADVSIILDYPKRHPGCEVVRLETNYRSTARIVDLAHEIIRHNPKRHDKHVRTGRGIGGMVMLTEHDDEIEEAEAVVDELRDEVGGGTSPDELAILFRTNDQSRSYEQLLRKERLPYRILGGRSFFDRKEVLDVLAYLRLAVNRSDEQALLRIINVPSRGIGAKALSGLREAAKQRERSAWAVLESVARPSGGLFAIAAGDDAETADLSGEFGNRLRSSIASLVEVVNWLDDAGSSRQQDLVDQLLERLDYRAEIERTYPGHETRESRWNLAREVQDAWGDHVRTAEDPSLSSFVDDLALSGAPYEPAEGSGITLATVHAAKGLEWQAVSVVGLEDGILPHSRNLEDPEGMAEERRLLYVAVTRAKDRLRLSRARSRGTEGKSTETVLSRFLQDVPDELLTHRDLEEPATQDSAQGHLDRLRSLSRRDDE
ncbi:MAG: UvrD-helicase domain-containing protein [Acidobacteriota bacterium]